METLIHKESDTRFERATLIRFAESSLDFEVVYWIRNREFQDALEIQHRINISILEKFKNQKIEFAFPTRTILLTPQKKLEL